MSAETSIGRKNDLILDLEERIRRQKSLIARLEQRNSGLLPTARDLLQCLLETRRILGDASGAPVPAGSAPAAPDGSGAPSAEAFHRDLSQLASHAAAQDMWLAREFLALVQQGLREQLSDRGVAGLDTG